MSEPIGGALGYQAIHKCAHYLVCNPPKLWGKTKMRWYWLDRFTELVSGQYAVATKCVSMGEEHIHGYLPSFPMLPQSLIVEGIAQTAGLLIGESTAYQAKVVLAKVSRATFHFPPRPGDTLTYKAVIESKNNDGVRIHGTSHVGDRLQAEVELFLAILGERYGDQQMFIPSEFARLLRVLRVYEVGRTADGQPLSMPPAILALEQAALE